MIVGAHAQGIAAIVRGTQGVPRITPAAPRAGTIAGPRRILRELQRRTAVLRSIDRVVLCGFLLATIAPAARAQFGIKGGVSFSDVTNSGALPGRSEEHTSELQSRFGT